MKLYPIGKSYEPTWIVNAGIAPEEFVGQIAVLRKRIGDPQLTHVEMSPEMWDGTVRRLGAKPDETRTFTIVTPAGPVAVMRAAEFVQASTTCTPTPGLIVYLVWWSGIYEDELRAIYFAKEAADEHAATDSDFSVEARPVLASPLPKMTAMEKR